MSCEDGLVINADARTHHVERLDCLFRGKEVISHDLLAIEDSHVSLFQQKTHVSLFKKKTDYTNAAIWNSAEKFLYKVS